MCPTRLCVALEAARVCGVVSKCLATQNATPLIVLCLCTRGKCVCGGNSKAHQPGLFLSPLSRQGDTRARYFYQRFGNVFKNNSMCVSLGEEFPRPAMKAKPQQSFTVGIMDIAAMLSKLVPLVSVCFASTECE